MSATSGQARRDWRLPVIWLVLFAVSIATRTYVAVSDEAHHGHVIGIGRPLVDEISSHLMVAALLPALTGCIAAGRSPSATISRSMSPR